MVSLSLYPPHLMKYNAAEHKWYHVNGSVIEFGYLESDASVQIYQSAEYDVIRIDEASHMSEYRITYMKSRIRGANDYPKQLKLTSNPGGTGHRFLKKRFKIGINKPEVPFKEYIGKDEMGKEYSEMRVFIPAKVYDNEFLMKSNPDYIKNLLQLPEKERKQLLEGSWDVYEDQAFPEFDYSIHVCEPFIIPQHWKRWLAVDNGYDDPFAWYWHAVDEQGTVYVYREFTREKGDMATMIIYEQQAEKVVERSTHVDINGKEYREKFMFIVAGHDAWGKHVRDQKGKTIINYYQEGGLYGFIEGVKDRRLRKAVLHEYLRPYRDGNTGKKTAKLKIFNTCKKLIEMLPEMQKDPDDNEKYLDVEDHWVDALAYGLCAYHAKKSRGLKAKLSELEEDRERLWKSIRMKNRRFM
jgi:hypothetical protein